MAGFPAGFQLRPGDKVTLINDENGPSVRPLVRVIADSSVEVQGGQARAGGHTFALSNAAVQHQQGSGDLVLFIVEREPGAEAAQQVMAVRRRR
jgi:hypothetical protein